jgi:hypothetical protein
VEADSELTALMDENRLLSGMQPADTGMPPARERLMAAATARVSSDKEQNMVLIERLLKGKSWYWQAATLALVVAVFALVAILPPSGQSYAQTDGYMLVFDLGPAGIDAEGHPQSAMLDDGLAIVNSFMAEHKAEGNGTPEAEASKVALAINAKAGESGAESLSVRLAVLGPYQELLEDLKAALMDEAGWPEPTVAKATWFHDNLGLLDPMAGVSISAFDHLFSFPEGTSAEDMEAEINEWLAAEKPDAEWEVDITLTQENGQTQVKVQLTPAE